MPTIVKQWEGIAQIIGRKIDMEQKYIARLEGACVRARVCYVWHCVYSLMVKGAEVHRAAGRCVRMCVCARGCGAWRHAARSCPCRTLARLLARATARPVYAWQLCLHNHGLT